MTINSNEEFYPIDSQGDFYGPYYLVSCRSSEKEFICVAESSKDYVHISFSTHFACRVTNSSFRDYDMRNRFCKHLIYEIKNSYYLEQTSLCYNVCNKEEYRHYLISLDDNIVDVITKGLVSITLSKALNESGTDISNNKEDIIGVVKVKPLGLQSIKFKNFDNVIFHGLKEIAISLVDFHDNYESIASNYGAVDLEIIMNPLKIDKEKWKILFPEILCYKESSISQEILNAMNIKIDLPMFSAIYEIHNSRYKEWLAYAGYRQLYGEPISLRHIRILLHNIIYDVIIDVKEKQPYYVKNDIVYYF